MLFALIILNMKVILDDGELDRAIDGNWTAVILRVFRTKLASYAYVAASMVYWMIGY